SDGDLRGGEARARSRCRVQPRQDGARAMSLRSEMIAAVGEDHVKDVVIDERAGLSITPGSAAEVAEVIRRANALGVAVHPVGAGGHTAAPGRDRTERERVFVSTKRLDQVLQLDEQ